jgi:hypothetical protein
MAREKRQLTGMRIFILIVVTLGLLAAVALAVYMRQYPMPAERWHVDPAAVTPRDQPEFLPLPWARTPRASPAPRWRSRCASTGRQGRPRGADRRRSGIRAFMTYVARSRVFGFPDAVSIRLHEEGDATRSTSSRARRSGITTGA